MKSYCDIKYVYSVYEILPNKWCLMVHYLHPNGKRGGLCRFLDELAGRRCHEKLYDQYKLAQETLNRLAKLNGWQVYEG